MPSNIPVASVSMHYGKVGDMGEKDKGCAVISVSFIAIKLTNIVIKLTIIVNFAYKYCLFKIELYLNIAQWRTRNVR